MFIENVLVERRHVLIIYSSNARNSLDLIITAI